MPSRKREEQKPSQDEEEIPNNLKPIEDQDKNDDDEAQDDELSEDIDA